MPADRTDHQFFSVRSADLDEVVSGGQRLLPLASIDRLRSADDTVVHFDWATIGSVTIADTANSGGGLRVRVNELERFYYIGWARLMRLLGDEVHRDGVLHQPMTARQLTGAALTGLLLAADHPYRDLLANPPPLLRPRPVRRTIDAIQANPEQPFTPTDLAEVAGVSVRGLQNAFRQHVGMSPMEYLRHVRLERAHRELSHADPQEATVAGVAHRWGFTHLGRFAAYYRARYGTLPSRTLRDGS